MNLPPDIQKKVTFRAWDKTTEAWLKPEAITIDGNGKVFLFGEYYPINENIEIVLQSPSPPERSPNMQGGECVVTNIPFTGDRFDPAQSSPVTEAEKEFQWRVHDWMLECFGEKISSDLIERNHRFIEEALELVQATGATQSECHQLVDYVFNRPVGEINQEVGGVMVTLAALCNVLGLSVNKAGEKELERIWTKVDKIRAKQAAKPKHSPLPAGSAWQPGEQEGQSFLWQEVHDDLRVLRELVAGGYDTEAKQKEIDIKSKYTIAKK